MRKKKRTPTVSSIFADRRAAYAVLVSLLILQMLWLRWMGVLALSNMRVGGVDPIGYYVYLPSLIFDHDLDFADEYAHFQGIGDASPDQPRTATGKMPNPFAIGVAILWLPFFLIGHLAALAGHFPTDGLSPPYQIAVYLGNVVYGFAGILLIYRLIEREFTRPIALLATVLIWFASGVLYYLFPLVPMSHMPSMFVVALFITIWFGWREQPTRRGYLTLGAVAGLAALVRWQNALFLIMPGADILSEVRRRGIRRDPVLHTLTIGGTFLVVFFPQMVVWKVLYGSFVTVPQGTGFLSWFKPDFFDVLFSSRHGLFSWTPIILVAVIGLFMFPREERTVGYLLAGAFALQLYMNSVAGWVGWSFGMRRFMNCSALFGLGLAALLTKLQQHIRLRYLVIIAVLPIIWNILFVVQYYFELIPRDDYLTFQQFVLDKFTTLVLLLTH